MTKIHGHCMSKYTGQDPQTGNWWLITTRTIGYWSKEIFTHLRNNASIIRYGGIAGAKPQTPFFSDGKWISTSTSRLFEESINEENEVC